MYCYCYICRDGFAAVELAECDVCGKTACHVCRVCAQMMRDELEHAKERWEEEHVCFRLALHATTARRYLERGLADLHSARVRLEAGATRCARESCPSACGPSRS
jgi:protein-arginine kinase activator protein McsA